MRFPVWFENFQIKYLNRAMKPLAKFTPGMSVIKHRGRTSGTQYETVVSAFRKGDTLAVMLGHGIVRGLGYAFETGNQTQGFAVIPGIPVP